jgi:hypothetical protein
MLTLGVLRRAGALVNPPPALTRVPGPGSEAGAAPVLEDGDGFLAASRWDASSQARSSASTSSPKPLGLVVWLLPFAAGLFALLRLHE